MKQRNGPEIFPGATPGRGSPIGSRCQTFEIGCTSCGIPTTTKESRRNIYMRIDLTFTPARSDQLPVLDEIRKAAFAPIFASFRSILGDEVYEAAQAREDGRQGELLISLLQPDSGWEVYAVEQATSVVGFVALKLDRGTKVGEIGLNAVHPDRAGKGVGTAMYEFAVSRMKEAGMRVATVATGGDPSHAPARRAYRKAGFNLEIPSVWMCRGLS
jgi:GNAT superfamily N-acetyltransferase